MFHNSFLISYKIDFKYIWIPLSKDAEYYVSFFLDYSKTSEVEVEDTLLPFLSKKTKDNINFFSLDNEKKLNDKKGKIFLYAQSDTLANSCLKIYNSLKDKLDCTLVYPEYKDEGAKLFFENQGIEAIKFSKKIFKNKPKGSKFFLLNDWSKEAKRIVSFMRICKIPTFCIQESIIDFSGNRKRMQFSDYALVQGIQTVLDLDRRAYFISGNPRYSFDKNQKPPQVINDVLINCNFTYGIFEKIRDTWIDDIVEVLENNKLNFSISKHPRDFGDLSRYKSNIINSNSSNIAEQIKHSDLIITRFSSIIHEAILQKKVVIYYNPHDESMKYDFRFNDEFLFICKSKNELKQTVSKIVSSSKETIDNKIEEYTVCHCLPIHTSTFKEIFLIANKNFLSKKTTWKDYINQFVFSPFLLKSYRKIFK